MALDTAQKRYSVPGVGRPFMRSQFPVAAADAGWRASVGLTLLVVPAVVVVPVVRGLGGGGPAISFQRMKELDLEKKKRDVDIAVAMLMVLSEK